jgi:hypothetical protein
MNFQYSIVGLPRSRTYWFSQLLTFGDNHCFHDFHAYSYKIPKRKNLGNCSFTPWQKHTGKVIIIERDRVDAEVSFLNFIDKPDIELTEKIFDKAEESLTELEGLRIPFDRINERIFDIINYIGIDVPMDRIEKFLDMKLESDDTSEENSKVNYA